ncbi:MAG: hypothetical protein NTW86_01980 [Candidatus Sumerlaeota bacterium]|nr:hypothetical protein [Candidatus Sumerlaeota bacterium]
MFDPTRWQGELADGAASFRGFFGQYEANVDGYELVQFWMKARDKRDVVVRTMPE